MTAPSEYGSTLMSQSHKSQSPKPHGGEYMLNI